MTFEQKKARAIALMDSKKMWRSNYAPPLLRILWRLGSKRLVRTVLIFTESSDQLSRATDRVPGLPASPGYVQ